MFQRIDWVSKRLIDSTERPEVISSVKFKLRWRIHAPETYHAIEYARKQLDDDDCFWVSYPSKSKARQFSQLSELNVRTFSE